MDVLANHSNPAGLLYLSAAAVLAVMLLGIAVWALLGDYDLHD